MYLACVGCATCDGGTGACSSACYDGYVKNSQSNVCQGNVICS